MASSLGALEIVHHFDLNLGLPELEAVPYVWLVGIGLSVLFLVMYVAYHMTSDSVAYGGEGFSRYVYYFILITHVLLSIGVIPFVLITYVRALTGNFDRHRKIAKITFPIWLYVAVTGVIVYLMISPYYP